MFQNRNKTLRQPTNENEYFFDRDGHIFRYIMQFYRTGELPWPVPCVCTSSTKEKETRPPISHQEICRECEYFLIPRHNDDDDGREPSFERIMARRVDEFVEGLKGALYETILNFKLKVGITFHLNNRSPPTVNPQIDAVAVIMKPFACVGYHILHMFGCEVERHLSFLFPQLVVRVDKFLTDTPRAHVNIYMYTLNHLDREAILAYSCLAPQRPSESP
jgi:hypothetical protein